MDRILTCPNPAKWLDRIAAAASPEGDCWIWQFKLDRNGYGRFDFRVPSGGKRATGAHRAAWLAYRSDIPADLVVDHLCRKRACVNPWHMELVSNQVNSIRGDQSGKVRSGRRPGVVGCSRHGGSASGYWYQAPQGHTRWVCRPCRNDRNSKRGKDASPE